MCGRTRAAMAPERVLRAAGTQRWVNREAYRPSHNVMPGAATPVVRQAADGGAEICSMRWGLVPSFTKKDDRPDFFRMFNARSETLAEKASFKRLVASRRCLVLVEAFYEWKQENGGKQPYCVRLAAGAAGEEGQGAAPSGASAPAPASASAEAGEEPLMVMAGLWDVWEGPEGPLETYAIVTTDASPRLAWLHSRQPVILRTPEQQQLWLDVGKAAGGMQKLFAPYNGADLAWHPVTPKMSNPRFQGPECSRPLKKPAAKDFFKPRGAAAAAQAAPPAGPADDAGVKQEPASGSLPSAAAAVKQEGGAGPDPQQQQQQEQQAAAAEPAAVNADQAPAPKPSPQPLKPPKPAASPGQKRKQSSGGSGSGKKKSKAERPAGVPDLRSFFSKT